MCGTTEAHAVPECRLFVPCLHLFVTSSGRPPPSFAAGLLGSPAGVGCSARGQSAASGPDPGWGAVSGSAAY